MSRDIAPTGSIRNDEGIMINFLLKAEVPMESLGEVDFNIALNLKTTWYENQKSAEKAHGSLCDPFNTYRWDIGIAAYYSSLRFAVFFQEKDSPSGSFQSAQRLGLSLCYKDSFSSYFSFHPYCKMWKEVNERERLRLYIGSKPKVNIGFVAFMCPVQFVYEDEHIKNKCVGTFSFAPGIEKSFKFSSGIRCKIGASYQYYRKIYPETQRWEWGFQLRCTFQI